jgi:hypothetical protein
LIVFNAEPGKAVIKDNIWVMNSYKEEFEIESTSSVKGLIEVLNMEKVGDQYKLTLQITPPDNDQVNKIFTDEFIVKIKGGEEINVRCRGFMKAG